MTDKRLIVDCLNFDCTPDIIKESYEKNGKLIVSGVLQRANAKNQNGRIYPKEILKREVEKYQTLVKERRALGELDHPDSAIVNLSNVSHNITDIHWDGEDVVGTVEILTTPSGNILAELFKNNIKVGISSRGMASTKPIDDNTVEVCDDFELIAFDFVSNPSTIGAFLSPIHESYSPNNITNKYSTINNIIMDILSSSNNTLKI